MVFYLIIFMQNFNIELTSNPIIRYATSNVHINSLTMSLSKRAKNGVVQIFNPEIIFSENQLSCAYLNSISTFKRKSNLSKSIAMEMLLFVAMTKKIDEAVKIAGARSNAGFILFCDTNSTYKKVLPILKNISLLKIPDKKRTKILTGLAPLSGEEAEVFERMAVSRLYD